MSTHPLWDNLPAACRILCQWVLWKTLLRDGKPTKIPLDRFGQPASSTAVHTWCQLAEAREAFEGGLGDGVGFVFTRAAKITGIDLDHCRDPFTGVVDEWARKIADRLRSYTEISPSGEGLHIIIKGSLPQGVDGRRKGFTGDGYRPNAGIEMYCSGRYFTVTGNRLEEYPSTVEDRQGELMALFEELFGRSQEEAGKKSTEEDEREKASLSDEAVIARMLGSVNTAEIDRLLRGDTSAYGGDDSAADQAICNHLAFWTGKNRQQMDRIFRSSGLMRPKWDEKHGSQTYGERTIDNAIRDTPEVYRPTEKNQILADLQRTIDFEELTEGGNAARLERLHGDDLRYNHTCKKWFVWDGVRWKMDTNGASIRLATDVVSALYQAAAAADNKDSRREFAHFARETDSRRGIRNLLSLASNRLKFACTSDDFDKDEWLVCTKNVMIDLKTGLPQASSREALITKTLGTKYDATAKCPMWLEFLERIFPNKALRDYVKKAVGYCLTGSMAEQIFFFCYGQGANGKSVFLAVLRALLGEYARQADFDTFLLHRNERVRNDLAALAGARVITTTEAEEGGRLSMQVIKSWTGGDPVTARFLFGENFTFKPQGKLWLTANNKPAITERNYAAWRRVRLIPFTTTIPEGERIPEYETVLCQELPGILNWALEGLKEYRENGLSAPQIVVDATNEYRLENDSLEQFVFECCETGDLLVVKNTALYAAYSNFCAMSGLKALPQNKFSMELKARDGIKQFRDKHGINWVGITLKSTWETEEVTTGVGPASPTSIAGDALV